MFYRDVKKVKENKPKIQNRFLCNGSTPRTSPFHMYNLGKVDVYSEPRQIPKVDLFAITAVSGFKSLTVFTNGSTSDVWQR